MSNWWVTVEWLPIKPLWPILADVFVLSKHRGKGLSKWMLESVLQHPDLQNLRRWILLTDDAHGLYKQFGWTELGDPGLYMERLSK